MDTETGATWGVQSKPKCICYLGSTLGVLTSMLAKSGMRLGPSYNNQPAMSLASGAVPVITYQCCRAQDIEFAGVTGPALYHAERFEKGANQVKQAYE